jgi:hypothetical protein
MSASIEDLKDFSDMHPLTKENILLGNGLSMGVTKIFGYASLRRVARLTKALSASDDEIFQQLHTTDFELVLRRLQDAAEINAVLGQPNRLHYAKYGKLKSALVNAISFIHPEYRTVNDDWLKGVSRELSPYKKIFTTNYDLLLYWIIGSVDFRNFVDFFWATSGSNLKFNVLDVDNRDNKAEVYYIHGALFLFTEDDVTQKIKSGLANDLRHLIRWHILKLNHLPLFVSEGKYQEKQKVILQNEYLQFALIQFSSISDGLTIYGHSLNEEVDKHLIDAINNNHNLNHLAISIYTKNQDIGGHITSMEYYLSKFAPFLRRGGEVRFFGFESSPFSYEMYSLPF